MPIIHFIHPDHRTENVEAVSVDEDELLDGTASERLPNSRLSCQIEMTAELDGLVLRLPQRQT